MKAWGPSRVYGCQWIKRGRIQCRFIQVRLDARRINASKRQRKHPPPERNQYGAPKALGLGFNGQDRVWVRRSGRIDTDSPDVCVDPLGRESLDQRILARRDGPRRVEPQPATSGDRLRPQRDCRAGQQVLRHRPRPKIAQLQGQQTSLFSRRDQWNQKILLHLRIFVDGLRLIGNRGGLDHQSVLGHHARAGGQAQIKDRP